jgi:hypothetical protein
MVHAVWAFEGGFGACDEDPFVVEGFDIFRLDEAVLVDSDGECTERSLSGSSGIAVGLQVIRGMA